MLRLAEILLNAHSWTVRGKISLTLAIFTVIKYVAIASLVAHFMKYWQCFVAKFYRKVSAIQARPVYLHSQIYGYYLSKPSMCLAMHPIRRSTDRIRNSTIKQPHAITVCNSGSSGRKLTIVELERKASYIRVLRMLRSLLA